MSNLKNIKLTESQERVFNKIKDFVNSKDRIFILKGYAGTGKTTLMKFLVEYLKENEKNFELLSPTGRASKILANYTNCSASTIHSMIYCYKSFNRDIDDINDLYSPMNRNSNQLYLIFEPVTYEIIIRRQQEEAKKLGKKIKEYNGKVYIIDESSMISDNPTKQIIQAKFGSGRLLYELLNYDTHKNSKFIFVGDPAQLPPVKDYFSPALDKDYIRKTFSYSVQEDNLTEIMRQQDTNTIIQAASNIRKLWENAPEEKVSYLPYKVWGILDIRKYKDVHILPNIDNLKEHYHNDIKQFGYNHSIFICRSNSACKQISDQIRKELGFTDILNKGDILMVCQNQHTTGLMNGDMIEVVNVLETTIRTPYNRYRTPLTFTRIKVKELFTKKEYTTLLINETISSENNNLDKTQQTSLFIDFIARMKTKNITQKKNQEEFNYAMRKDPYLNALRCSYGYAVTCHKAQGGEWKNVYIQIPRNFTLNPTKEVYQWLYTAVTRAKEKVFFVDDFYFK